MKVPKSIRHAFACLALASLFEAGLVYATEVWQDTVCSDRPSDLNACTSWGGYYCTNRVQNCTGNCKTCAGPGGFPARMCIKSKGDTCTNSPGSCGAATPGNCQSSGGICFCDGNGESTSDCTFGNC